MKGRLSCADGVRLRGRLERRGVALSIAAMTSIIAGTASATPVPIALASSTIRVSALFAAGQATAATAPVAFLTEAMLHAMYYSKLKTTVAVTLSLAVLGGGLGWLGIRTLGKPAFPEAAAFVPSPVEKPAEKQPESAVPMAWL